MQTIVIFTLSAAFLSHAHPDLDEAKRLLQRGQYEEAIEQFVLVEKQHPLEAAIGKARCSAAQGRDAEAIAILTKANEKADSPDLRAELANLHLNHGDFAKAKEQFDKAIEKAPNHLLARWIRLQTLSQTGKLDEAKKESAWFVSFYNKSPPSDAESLVIIALASAEYSRWNQLSDQFTFILNDLLLGDALKADADHWQARVEAGKLLLEKYKKGEASQELQAALKINPNAVEALVGMAAASLQEYDFLQTEHYLHQALVVNPQSIDALQLKADLYLAQGQLSKAPQPLEQARKSNPNSQETLGRLAASYILLRKPGEAKELEKHSLQSNPRPAVFHEAFGDFMTLKRRFDLAEPAYRKAVALGPHRANSWNGLATVLMAVGKEDEAKKVLAQARKLDPFHVRIKNFVDVLEHLSTYKKITTPHYEVYHVPGSGDLLGRYVSEFLEEQHQDLCTMFGYSPPERIKIELMKDHQWFSGRVVGLPSIGTVGACTGKVVALMTPNAQPPAFHWGNVLRHEVTHAITLQQTNFSIPHWYTEALAVISERSPRPQHWNPMLKERVRKGELFNLDNLNHAFVRPRKPEDWQMAYCQSLLYAEYFTERFGKEVHAKLLASYRDGLETDEIIASVLKVNKRELEQGYRDFLNKTVAQIGGLTTAKVGSRRDVESAISSRPDDPSLNAQLAMIRLGQGKKVDARELAQKALEGGKKQRLALTVLARLEMAAGKLNEAKVLFEQAFDPANPDQTVLELLASLLIKQKEYDKAIPLYEAARKRDPLNSKWVEGLGRVYLLQKEEAKLGPVLEEIARMEAENIKVRKKLVDMALKKGDLPKAAHWAREVSYINVSDPVIPRVRGEAALKSKQYFQAVRELELAVKNGAAGDDTELLLAEALIGTGEKSQARQILQAYLRSQPDSPKAKQLLEGLEKP